MRLARSPSARMIVVGVSRPARTSAGGGMIWSVKLNSCLVTCMFDSPSDDVFLSAATDKRVTYQKLTGKEQAEIA